MKETLQQLEEKHTKKVNSLFMMCLEILFIFGVPAFGILAIYKFMSADPVFIKIGLPAAFFLSWFIFILRWKKLSQEVIQLEKELKEARVEEEKKKKELSDNQEGDHA